jgi:hypothetical protein
MRFKPCVLLMIAPSIFSAGCAATAPQVLRRDLPPAASVVRAPVPLPVARRGDSAIVYSARALQAADEGNKRLIESRENYEQVRRIYSGAQ